MPIDLKKARKIAVIGENAIKMMTVGGGSSSLKVKYELSPLDGIRKRVGDQAEVMLNQDIFCCQITLPVTLKI